MSNTHIFPILSVLRRSTVQVLIIYKQTKKAQKISSHTERHLQRRKYFLDSYSTTIRGDHMSQTLEKHPLSYQQYINMLI